MYLDSEDQPRTRWSTKYRHLATIASAFFAKFIFSTSSCGSPNVREGNQDDEECLFPEPERPTNLPLYTIPIQPGDVYPPRRQFALASRYTWITTSVLLVLRYALVQDAHDSITRQRAIYINGYVGDRFMTSCPRS